MEENYIELIHNVLDVSTLKVYLQPHGYLMAAILNWKSIPYNK